VTHCETAFGAESLSFSLHIYARLHTNYVHGVEGRRIARHGYRIVTWF
jgi:hypothetical protein